MPLTTARLIDPDVLAGLVTSGFFPATCDIQANTPTRSSSGYPTPAWGNVSGLTAIPCTVARREAVEQRLPDLVTTDTTHIIALAGDYPTITPKHRAVVEGTSYDILGVRTDIHDVMTWLSAEIRTASG